MVPIMLVLLVRTNERLPLRMPKQSLVIEVTLVVGFIDTLHASCGSNMGTMRLIILALAL